MKLTRACVYAFHAVAYMAERNKDEPIASHLIARERDISEKFLLKVLKPLVSANILHSVKGPRGGYRLARTAESISLLDVVEAVDGPVRCETPDGHLDHHVNRNLDAYCRQIADSMRKQLAKIKVADLNGK